MIAAAPRAKATAPGKGSRQVLGFSVGAQSYGVDILRVQEIRRWTAVTTIPGAPAHVVGLLNLRGTIVPVVDLRVRFGLSVADITPMTVTIILSLPAGDGAVQFGLVVDSVTDVIDVTDADLRQRPALDAGAATAYVEGIAIAGERVVVLLKADALLPRDVPATTVPNLASVA